MHIIYYDSIMKMKWKRIMALGQAFSVVAIMDAQVVNPFGNALVPDMIADASIQEIDMPQQTDMEGGWKHPGLRWYGSPGISCIGVSTGHISRRLQLRSTGLPVKLSKLMESITFTLR